MGLVRRATTLAELMVVMAIWSVLLVLILGFYVSANQVHRRHARVSDDYRKVHTWLEVVESLLCRSRIYQVHPLTVNSPLWLVFSRQDARVPLSLDGRSLWLPPETLALDCDPEKPRETVGPCPLYPILVLVTTDPASNTLIRKTICKFDPGMRVNLAPPIEPPTQAPDPLKDLLSKHRVLEFSMTFPPSIAGPIRDLAEVRGQQKTYSRYILLENALNDGSVY